MRRILIYVAVGAVILFASAAVAEARPVVNFGTHTVGACDYVTSGGGTNLKGCTIRRVWFSNHTDKKVTFDDVELNGTGFLFTPDPFTDSTCIEWFYIPANGACFVKVVGGAAHVGGNHARLTIKNHRQTLRLARLVITGR